MHLYSLSNKKRNVDLALAFLILIPTLPIFIAVTVALILCGQMPIFRQQRIGRNRKAFWIYKFKTMNDNGPCTTVTTANDTRITPIGRILRKSKIDELPQLFNVITGEMSFVGPRPDVAEFASLIPEDQSIYFNIRPGITGPATLKYRNEEALLAGVKNAEEYAREIIWPDKVLININYIHDATLLGDLRCMMETIIPTSVTHSISID